MGNTQARIPSTLITHTSTDHSDHTNTNVHSPLGSVLRPILQHANADSELKSESDEQKAWMHRRHNGDKEFAVLNERKYIRPTQQAKKNTSRGVARYTCSSRGCNAQILIEEASGSWNYNHRASTKSGKTNMHDPKIKHEVWDETRQRLHSSQADLIRQMNLNPDSSVRDVFYNNATQTNTDAGYYGSYGGGGGVKWLMYASRSKGIRHPRNKKDLIAMLDAPNSMYAKTAQCVRQEEDRKMLDGINEKLKGGYKYKFNEYSLEDVPRTRDEWDRLLEISGRDLVLQNELHEAIRAGRRQFYLKDEKEEMSSPELDRQIIASRLMWLGAAGTGSSLVFATKKSCQVRQFLIFVSVVII
jgi:hypothetical protein